MEGNGRYFGNKVIRKANKYYSITASKYLGNTIRPRTRPRFALICSFARFDEGLNHPSEENARIGRMETIEDADGVDCKDDSFCRLMMEDEVVSSLPYFGSQFGKPVWKVPN